MSCLSDQSFSFQHQSIKPQKMIKRQHLTKDGKSAKAAPLRKTVEARNDPRIPALPTYHNFCHKVYGLDSYMGSYTLSLLWEPAMFLAMTACTVLLPTSKT